MEIQKHTLRNKVDRDGAKEFFATLREHPTTPAVKRVENVLNLLVAADAMAREQREKARFYERAGKDWRREDVKSFRESFHASTRICGQLNDALLRYSWIPLVYIRAGRFTVTERATTASTGQWASWETWAVVTLLNLAKKPGELSRLRRCAVCSQWFHAVRDYQPFCGAACRRRNAAQNPEFKEKRATYMRERYRPMEKERDARSKRLAKGKSK